jgi:geranylgeranyl diphosphate synthase, type I
MQGMMEEVIAGQMIDVDTMGGDTVDIAKLDAKNYYKSGAYTFCRPLVTGALLAGADKKTCKKREKIGVLLGKAYQMRDDILDVLIADGDDTTTYDNKTKFSDVQDGQQTYLTHYIYEHGTYAQRLALSQAMGKRLSSSQIKHLRDIFQDS